MHIQSNAAMATAFLDVRGKSNRLDRGIALRMAAP
jgi:hypothetical protein